MRTLVLLLAAGLLLTSCEPTAIPDATETLPMLDDPRVRSQEEVREQQEPPRYASMATTASATPVTLTIWAPTEGATVTGSVLLRAGTSDGRTRGIDFYLGSQRILYCFSPCDRDWDTRSTPNGTYTLTARTYDDDYNEITSAPVSITVDQDLVPPTVELLSPTGDVTVGETFLVRANAADDRGQVLVRVFMDGAFYDVLSFVGGALEKTVNTHNLANGPHTMSLEARDPSNNITFSRSITVTVDRDVTPPSVALTSPTSAVTVPGGQLALAADASDDRGLAKVVFLLDGYWVGEDTTAPFTATFDTYGVLNGDYTLVAKAYDLVGNVGTSAGVTVTIKHPHGAEFDPTLGAPVCRTVNALCDTMKLVVGRAGAELNTPNTLDGCADGQGPEYYAERVQRIIVTRVGGEFLAENRRARIDVLVPAPSYNLDSLDLYYASDATTPSWTYLTTLRPNPYGTQYLTTEYLLPEGPLQAVRAQFRVSNPVSDPSTQACSTGTFDDHDDLAFAVGPPTDGLSPTVTLLAPYTSALVGGLVTLTASAQDDLAVERVEFFADGVRVGTDTSAPYEASWNSASVPDGVHSLSAKAYDASGHVGTSATVQVKTDNTAPLATLVSPTQGMLLRGNIVPTATVSDANGVTKFDFYDGEERISLRPIDANTRVWFTSEAEDGPHTLYVRAQDGAGNVGISPGVAVILDNTAPTSELTAPEPGTRLRGTVQASATANDANGVTKVEFYAGETLIGTATTAPYTVNWDTRGVADGTVTLKERAYDRAGNSNSKAFGYTYTVDNTAPTVALTSPANGASLFLSTTLQASAADNMGVTQVVFYDGAQVLGTDTTAPYSFSWSLLFVTKGNHTLTAKAFDAAGNVTTSAPITVKVN